MKPQHWNYAHLPAHLQAYSKPFADIARQMSDDLPQSAELNAGLRKLMEAKDCFVRAAIETYGVRPAGVDVPMRRWSEEKDPITGQPLAEGSPYSMAHVPVTPAGRQIFRSGPLIDINEKIITQKPEIHRNSCDKVSNRMMDCNCDRGESSRDYGDGVSGE